LPARYIPRIEYTEETRLFVPVIPAFVRFAVAMALEALIANYINNVPLIVRIATFFIAAFFFAVLEQQRWFRFKSRRSFVSIVTAICLTYAAIWAVALLYFREPSPQNPELIAAQIKLAAALREKDIAISQRDEARREHDDA
jgi:FlaA1/EpsC-like NDP-sugar epimerase